MNLLRMANDVLTYFHLLLHNSTSREEILCLHSTLHSRLVRWVLNHKHRSFIMHHIIIQTRQSHKRQHQSYTNEEYSWNISTINHKFAILRFLVILLKDWTKNLYAIKRCICSRKSFIWRDYRQYLCYSRVMKQGNRDYPATCQRFKYTIPLC